MKKSFLYAILLLISINLVLGATVTREMPTTSDAGRNITIKLKIQNASTADLFTIVETILGEFPISSWR